VDPIFFGLFVLPFLFYFLVALPYKWAEKKTKPIYWKARKKPGYEKAEGKNTKEKDAYMNPKLSNPFDSNVKKWVQINGHNIKKIEVGQVVRLRKEYQYYKHLRENNLEKNIYKEEEKVRPVIHNWNYIGKVRRVTRKKATGKIRFKVEFPQYYNYQLSTDILFENWYGDEDFDPYQLDLGIE